MHVRELVHALDVARYSTHENMVRGMEFIRTCPEWVELIKPDNRADLMDLVDIIGGLDRMNKWAKEFYAAALAASEGK